MYGPVAGTRSFVWSRAGVEAGTGYANVSASFDRKSASGALRRNETVREIGSVTIPRERSQRLAVHCAAPRMLPKYGTSGECGFVNSRSRSMARRKSSGWTSRPLE